MPDFVRRLYVGKKDGFDIEAKEVLNDLRDNMGIKELEQVLILNRYDILGLSDRNYENVRNCILVESSVDNYYENCFPYKDEPWIFAVEYIPGQYDQRASWAEQCIKIVDRNEDVEVYFAKIFIFKGSIDNEQFTKIKDYIINTVDSREASQGEFDINTRIQGIPEDVCVVNGFNEFNDGELIKFKKNNDIGMNLEDLKLCLSYFKDIENRDPFLTELKVIDTYWSDHCRHTTFTTEIANITIEKGKYSECFENTLHDYYRSRDSLYINHEKPINLMDLATINMKELKKNGQLMELEQSEEINACSIEIDVDVNGNTEKWLLMFKNETHNHPTEIEPFGGAATCLGGAIRDPLSGRAYVYAAMRITGCGDPREKIEDTLRGKLPQRKITINAAKGFSSYGNQIGVTTGYVKELYHPGFIAKRMEVGAVIGAVPKASVLRGTPEAGDVIILVGGRTGRDGCGGATGSSKIHNKKSIEKCGAEVQKGNATEERKLQRLFRNPEASGLIKRCNDFGAGGIAVAVGELADGLIIDLDKIPKKYTGLNGTELAISESQERMAVVLASEDAKRFIDLANNENLEATKIAGVTNNDRLKMLWRGKVIVDISRKFLNTNGAARKTGIIIQNPDELENYFKKDIADKNNNINASWMSIFENLNLCGQKGLVGMFDSTIGRGTVLMPYGGKYQGTPIEAMVHKIPVKSGETKTCSIMSYGYNPYLCQWSPFHGGAFGIVEAVTKLVAAGGDYKNSKLTLQEYFPKPGEDYTKWGKTFSALLGAYYTEKSLGIAAIGGKDSMSGTFEDIEVPSTLIAFAVTTVDVNNIVTPELKSVDNLILITEDIMTETNLPDFNKLKSCYKSIQALIKEGVVLSSHTVGSGGIAETVSLMSFGNRIGVILDDSIKENDLFKVNYGRIIIEVDKNFIYTHDLQKLGLKILGKTTSEYKIIFKDTIIDINKIYKKYNQPLENVFPSKTNVLNREFNNISSFNTDKSHCQVSIPKPKIFIPVFPGTNCEYDCIRAFEQAGGSTSTKVFKNLNSTDIDNSIKIFAEEIRNSQIIMLSGGFSASDEPDGSGKFIAAVFRNPRIIEAVDEFLNVKKGLILGICNGFQALIKLGLVPFGQITDMDKLSPTLITNEIGRHVSNFVRTKLVSNLSPWFSLAEVGKVYTVPVSHGEGRFIADKNIIENLASRGQIATQYVDLSDNAAMEMPYNPNGSYYAVEALTSPDGRILGKMAHNERISSKTFLNIPDINDMKIFEAGINYFK